MLSLVKFYHANFLSCVNDYIEDMATFTALVKIYSTKYFCSTKVAGLGEIFVKRKFSRIWYSNFQWELTVCTYWSSHDNVGIL